MWRLQQKVKVHCTNTDVTASGVVVKIRPDGIDVALDQSGGDVVVRCKKSHRPFVYVGNVGGMEFVVRTDSPQLGRG